MSGFLYLVATPIGNLADFSPRGLETLRGADLVACEDTRRSRVLLSHFGIRPPALLSYHEHNEKEQTERLLGELKKGRKVALVSDAGMPLLSDPGYRLVRAALEAGITVVPIPGADAIACALAASGLPAVPFTFLGFLPTKAGARDAALSALRPRRETLVFFESPHRILKTLKAMLSALGDRRAALAREMTKMHEEFLRNQLSEIITELERRGGEGAVPGEMTLVVEGASEEEAALAGASDPGPEAQMARLLSEGLSRREAAKKVAAAWGLSAAQAYRLGLPGK